MEFKLSLTETIVKTKLNRFYSYLNQPRYREDRIINFQDKCNKKDVKRCINDALTNAKESI